ncbi:helix-turn-helix domain-containing protein [Luteolibacter yonseiensis]|uniref:Helix-turn-helix domain-containing protein n=1 Tax=Luteolibacter yonseiensis TaxID=1144680 RepID=A0A934R2H1_9BACT|nr:helix-turn-helix domain-containing protein [Luteolibacter yonseiensis]MBK1814305.1 helix-turn-helix domain-containing protein [Luteolibacter yonseiensis]
MINADKDFEQTLFEKLHRSELFLTYQHAFRNATGLPLRLVDSDTNNFCLDDESVNRSGFCEKLHLCKMPCSACVDINHRLMTEALVNGPSTCHCFAGMAATAVPVRHGPRLIAFLKTGQVFTSVPAPKAFDELSKVLSRQGIAADDMESLKTAYLQTRAVEPERYQSMVFLLATFAEQLGKHVDKIALATEGAEPTAVARARKLIETSLADPLPLAVVARHAGLSESHFCRIFKEFTGLTLTDYINRRRIEWAKSELLKPEVRISEIAFQVGYQSLSQFNRSFARFTGSSPTGFRRRECVSLQRAD